MTCQGCGKVCTNRSDGRRAVVGGKVLFLCNACPADRPAADARDAAPATDAAGESADGAETADAA